MACYSCHHLKSILNKSVLKNTFYKWHLIWLEYRNPYIYIYKRYYFCITFIRGIVSCNLNHNNKMGFIFLYSPQPGRYVLFLTIYNPFSMKWSLAAGLPLEIHSLSINIETHKLEGKVSVRYNCNFYLFILFYFFTYACLYFGIDKWMIYDF